MSSRIASSDQLGLRICGRKVVRPSPQPNKGRVSWAMEVGAAVDVWRHDGWWEGIVVQKESDDRIRVFFPGKQCFHLKSSASAFLFNCLSCMLLYSNA